MVCRSSAAGLGTLSPSPSVAAGGELSPGGGGPGAELLGGTDLPWTLAKVSRMSPSRNLKARSKNWLNPGHPLPSATRLRILTGGAGTLREVSPHVPILEARATKQYGAISCLPRNRKDIYYCIYIYIYVCVCVSRAKCWFPKAVVIRNHMGARFYATAF